jgi:hypothetical protein
MAPQIKLLADKTYDNLTGPGLNPATNVEATSMVEKLVSQVIGVLTIVAVIFFIIQLILAGYGFISSQGDEKKMATNRQRLTDGVLGIFIVVVAIGVGTLISKLLGLNNPLDLGTLFTNMGL